MCLCVCVSVGCLCVCVCVLMQVLFQKHLALRRDHAREDQAALTEDQRGTVEDAWASAASLTQLSLRLI